MTSFFSNLRKQVGFHRQELDNTASNGELISPLPEDDQECDGFLLVGEKIKNCQINQVSDGSSPFNAADQAGMLPQQVSLAEETQLNSFANATAVPQTAVSDIPMDLHPAFKTKRHIDSIFQQVSLQPKSFNWAKYSYDFTSEELFLRDVEVKYECLPG